MILCEQKALFAKLQLLNLESLYRRAFGRSLRSSLEKNKQYNLDLTNVTYTVTFDYD